MHAPGIQLAYLVSQYPAVHHRYILREIRGLRKFGFDITVVSIAAPDRPPAQLDPEERQEFACALYVKPSGLAGAVIAHLHTALTRPFAYLAGLALWVRLSRLCPAQLFRTFLYFTEALIAGSWVRARGLRHVHVHYASQVAIFLERVFPITVSHTLHGPAEFENPLTFHLARKIAAARFVVAISSFGRSQLLRHCAYEHWSKVAVCRLGIDPGRFAPIPRRRNGPFRLITVGRLSPEKGHLVLLSALERLARTGRQLRLTVVGDGPFRKSLEKAAAQKGLADQVTFTGWVNNDAVAALYGEADAFALASFAEGLPVVLMEAMATGLPCVATRITGIPELIEHGRSGLLVTPAEDAALADAIARLYDDPELCAQIGEAGRRRVVEDYDSAKNVAHMAELFREHL